MRTSTGFDIVVTRGPEKTCGIRPLTLGQVKPRGWIRSQMLHDLEHGFVGHLDRLVPDLIVEDDIYGKDRLTAQVKEKDVGVTFKDVDWGIQFLWWNSETQSNWWDGVIRHAFLTDHAATIERVRAYVDSKLATQDEDGYIGIYDEDLRYRHETENGELWAQTTLFRGLLGYYEATGEDYYLDVARDVILDRLTTRRTCVDCGAIYNVKSMPTKVEGVCDKCGGNVVQRDDETEEAINNRLDVYNEKTAPLVGFYEKEGMLLNVTATSSDDVVATIQNRLNA